MMFPGAPEPFLDLSTGINPHPYPVPQLPAEVFARLPDSAALTELAAAAATEYGAPSPAHVACAPGTQILLPLVAGLVRPAGAAVLSPTYAEHARAARLAGHDVAEAPDLAAVAAADLAVVTNPNNPDGRLFDKDALLALAAHIGRRGGLLVVDETFADPAPFLGLAGDLARGNIVVLRSFGKFFGLAGIRLGFALAEPRLTRRIAAMLGPWAVSGPALAIGLTALSDVAWIERARRDLAAASERLATMLRDVGLELVGGTALFQLAQTPDAMALFRHLGRAGILTRAFPDHSTWLRFGLPAHEQDWQRLQSALAAFQGRG